MRLLVDRFRDAVENAGHRTRTEREGFRARCPAHDGVSDGSLAVTPKDGKLLVYCHGGCDTDAVLAAVGLDWSALSPADPLEVMTRTTFVPKPFTFTHDPAVLTVWHDEAHRRLLEAPEAGAARAYLRSRGVTGDDVRHYRLGFAGAHPNDKLHRLRSRIVFVEWPWRAEGRVVPGLEASTYKPERKYQTEGPKRAWGIGDVDPERPVVIVEGMLDRVAVGRLAGESQVVALCGSSGVKVEDVAALRTRGVPEVLLLLDADVDAKKLDRVMSGFSAGGVRPVAVNGLPDGDPGDLLPALDANDDNAWRLLSEALTTPEVSA